MPELTQRLARIGALLAKIEPVPGTLTVPSPTLDGLEVSEPMWTPDVQMVARDYVASDLSPQAGMTGMKTPSMTFTTELKGNSKGQSSTLADAPMISRLFQACGYALSAASTPATQIVGPFAAFDNANKNLAWGTPAGPITLTSPVLYTIQVTKAGASTVAGVRVYSNDPLVDATNGDTEIILTTGTAVALGTSGAKLTPTISGNLVVGQKYRVLVLPTGLTLKPVSGAAASTTLTLYMYKDGMLHRMPGSRGTFKITAVAGDIARVEFTFQGGFMQPLDAATPVVTPQDGTLPPIIEFSNLTWGKNRDLVAAQWTFDQANTLSPRTDVNSDDGIRSYRITDRAPAGGFNPEATLEADESFWDQLSRGLMTAFFSRVGTVPGQICSLFCPAAQLSNLPYGDRDGSLTYDVSFNAKRVNGDDDTFIFFN